MTDRLRLFRQIADNPGQYAREWKQHTSGPVFGYFCSYVPEEVITAAGGLPFRILPENKRGSLADGHLPPYVCGPVRDALEQGLSRDLDFLEGAVFVQTCDAMQRLSDIWRLNTGFSFHADVQVPVKLNTASGREYLFFVLKRFLTRIEEQTGVVLTEDRLLRAVKTGNRVRNELAGLYRLRLEQPAVINGVDLFCILRAAMVMDRERLARELSLLRVDLRAAEQTRGWDDVSQKRIVACGSVCSTPGIYQTLEQAGARVVWDDFCTGGRHLEGMVSEEGDRVEALADRAINRIGCPAKHSGLLSRGRHLLDLVKETRAEGVIVFVVKFCDPHAFDAPYLQEFLDQEQVPNTVIEIEDRALDLERIRTRAEAFIEML